MGKYVEIDEALLQAALATGKGKTPREVTELALEEFITRNRQSGVVDIFDSISYEKDFQPENLRDDSRHIDKN